MKFRNILGLGAIGGALYAHRKHGGEWTLESFKQSLIDLRDALQVRGKEIADKTQDKLREAADRVDEASQRYSRH